MTPTTGIRLIGVAQNPANGFPARLLEHDTEYKIRMRARYYRGEHEGKSWGGPWATETITVAGEPAETPTPEPTEEEPAKEEPVKRPPKDDPARDDPAPEDTTPAAPSLINTAVTEGQVLLSWSNPSDDSITGYQILRGPDRPTVPGCHRRRHGIKFDQLHRHGAPGGPDPHLRREGPQLRWAEPRRHRHRDRASSRSPHHRTA